MALKLMKTSNLFTPIHLVVDDAVVVVVIIVFVVVIVVVGFPLASDVLRRSSSIPPPFVILTSCCASFRTFFSIKMVCLSFRMFVCLSVCLSCDILVFALLSSSSSLSLPLFSSSSLSLLVSESAGRVSAWQMSRLKPLRRCGISGVFVRQTVMT